MLARWRGMAVYTDRHLDSLRRSLLEGKVACLAPGERTVAILEHLLDGGHATGRSSRRSATSRTSRVPVGRRAGAVHDRPRGGRRRRDPAALIRLHDALVTEILPNARSADRPGICDVPEGPDGYRRLIRVHTSLDLEAAEIHEIGLDEIAQMTASWPSSPAARSARPASRTQWPTCATIRRCTSRAATSLRHGRVPGRVRSGVPTGSDGFPRRRAR